MNNLLSGSLLWRFILFLGVMAKNSQFAAFFRYMTTAIRCSGTATIICGQLEKEATITQGSGLYRLSVRWHNFLHRLGQTLVPLVKGSLLYRFYGWIFTAGRNSRLMSWLFSRGLTGLILLVVGIYSLVDFLLRDVLAVPVLSSSWDEALLLVSILWIVYQSVKAPKPLTPRMNPLDVPVFLFFAVGLVLLFVAAPFFSIGIDGYRATVQYMLWFFCITRLLRDDGDFMFLYVALVMGAFLIALHGVYQYIVAAPIPSNWIDQAEQSVRTRVYSIFGSPNIMGDFLLMFAPMTAGLAYYFKNKKLQIFFWLVTFTMCFSCLFTMSRGAWAAMALAIVIFAILVDRRLLWLMLVAGVLAMFLPFVASRIGYMLSPEYAASTANGGRNSRWDLALKYLEMNPFWGFGLGMFGGAVAMQTKIYAWVTYFYVDNYYLKILVEMGILGMIFFVLLLVSMVYTGLRVIRRQKASGGKFYPLTAGIFSGLCGVLLHCYSENIFEEPYMMAYFWTLVALLVYAGFRKQTVQ